MPQIWSYATRCLAMIFCKFDMYALPLFIGPSKGKKSFVPLLAKAALAFLYYPDRVLVRVSRNTKNWILMLQSSKPMIVYHHHQRKKGFFLSLDYLPTTIFTTFSCHFPLSQFYPKNSADNPKKFRVFTFSRRCWRDICVA